jgi:hypothetical protein
VFRDLRKDPRFTQQLRRYEAKQRLVYERIPQTFSRHGLAWPPACAN